MTIETRYVHLSTQGNADIHEITPQVEQAVRKSALQNGIVTLFCPSSTSGLTTIEYEAGALSDLRRLFNEMVPEDRDYAHNARWHDGNGHSHVRAALLGPSLTIPFVDGCLTLGTWQQIIYIDFDVRPRNRKITVQIIGE
ncbi:MAG: YjbQ family protein [Anaerolineales bacterium]|nr:YjbQ family protein [Anaerolineales bacterium]